MFICVLAIATAFCLLGFAIIAAGAGFLGLVAGLGIAICGIMLVFFVIKFIFKRNPINNEGKIEIKNDEQPELFEFINRVTVEVGAPKPRRIFITAEVNAAVVFIPGFWSMFFPIKKNLQIGLGLVNSLNISEFKAVMAHEFGHFSQRSLKFGSYVYNLNRVIYNMLFENEGYDKILSRWARIHAIFRLMAVININIIKGIQAILMGMYGIVNKTYLGLSREMEFHADAVAAYASGSNQMINMLKRIEIGHLCYTNLLDYWNLKLSENKRAENIYPQHSEVIKLYADKRNFGQDAIGLPLVNRETKIESDDRIIIDDQWSSHPSNEDRELSLSKINLESPGLNESAWLLFRNPEALQLQLTNQIYSSVKFNSSAAIIGLSDFKHDFYALINTHLFHEAYKDFFDNRNLTNFDIDRAILEAANAGPATFAGLFSPENCALLAEIKKTEGTINALEQITEIRTDVKTFDYKGIKYKRGEAADIQAQLESRRANAVKQIEEIDKKAFIYFYNLAETPELRTQLVDKYRYLFTLQKDAVKHYDLHNDMMRAMNPVYGRMNPIQIMNTLDHVYKQERKIKPRIKEIIADEKMKSYMNEEQLKMLANYIDAKLVYYLEPTYDNKAISTFNKAMDAYISAISNRNYMVIKDLLDYQIRTEKKHRGTME